MPTLPWITLDSPGEAVTAVVMASRFRLKSLRHVPRFFFDAMRIHQQVRRADGALGVSLIAHPLRREFFTLSAWRDRTALDAMVGCEPHRSTMKRHRRGMAGSAFTFWEVPADQLPVGWDDARRALARERGE